MSEERIKIGRKSPRSAVTQVALKSTEKQIKLAQIVICVVSADKN